ncbi:MAG: type VI secretion system protein TssA [Gemmobacter sp.]|nr:type VI secretion system protein TssA [Gemmobacter sp.]
MLESLLTPRSNARPSGENLEYDSGFTALMLAAQPGEERQVGKEIVAGEEPKYTDVAERALEVLSRSHDLRVAVVWARAALAIDGLQGLVGPVSYICGCLEQYWDSCHPELDADDDNDPTMRVNAVLGLATQGTILAGLRSLPLADSRTFGRVSLRDIQIAEGEITPPEGATTPDKATIAAAFKETSPDALRADLAAARQLLDDLAGINRVFDEQIPGYGPDLSPLMRMIKRILSKLAEAVGEPETPAVPVEDVPADVIAPAAFAVASVPGAINSIADARAAIDRIIAYYESNEPSSPVPIFLHRARRLIGADFMSIMKDMAPQGVESVMMLGGIEDE